MKSAIISRISPTELSTRESLLKANSDLIVQLQGRLKAKRFRPQEGDNLKLGYMRVLLQAFQVQNAILKDSELEDLKQRLEVLEALQKAGSQDKEELAYPKYDEEQDEEYTD